MATTAFVTEFQSYMSFQCKSSPSQLKLDQYKNYDHKMAPCQITDLQQQDALISSISNPSESNQDSMSSMEASVESFSPEMNGHEEDKSPSSSSDDSDGVSNIGKLQIQDKSGHHPENQDKYVSPLMQMQAVYEKTDRMKKYSQQGSTSDSQNMNRGSRSPMQGAPLGSNGYIKCNFCNYVPTSEEDYNSHSLIHFPFKCTICNYAARTEGRLKSHTMKFHSALPPNTWVGGRKQKANGREGPSLDENRPSTAKVKSRVTKCKLCNFVGASKLEYYRHLRTIHPDKALTCDQCEFATIYKHHLEYHIRNHFGSKPFECILCNYKCVNKSMLNSHNKSHSNVYQFRCGGCSYATKYCHSLKMHLRKYDHVPGKTLNADGTPNTTSVIDVHGRRRGPKPKRRKQPSDSEVSQARTSAITPSSPTISYATNMIPLQPSPAPQIYFHPQIYNNFAGSVFMRPPALDNSNCAMFQPPFLRKDNQFTKCVYCDFVADSRDLLSQHIFAHVAKDNPDLMNRYNLNSDSMFQIPARQFGFNYPSNGNNFVDNIPRFEPSIEDRKVALTNVPNGEAIHQVNRSVDNNESRMSVSPRRSAVVPLDMKNLQAPMFMTPFLNGIHNKIQINESPVVSGSGAETDSPNSDLENHHSLESDHDRQDGNVEALDLSCKNNGFEAMMEVERMDNGSKSMTEINSSSLGQNGNFGSTRRHSKRKGRARRFVDYLPDDPLSDFPLQEYWNQSVPPAEMSLVKHETLTPRSNTNGTSHMSSVNFKSGEFRSNEEKSEALKKITIDADIHQKGRLNNQQFSVQKIEKEVCKSQPPSRASPTTVDNISMSNVVVKTEPIDVDSNTDISRLSDIFRCQYCDLIFGEIKMYTTHMRYHTPGDPFKCGRCGVKCYDRVSLFDHFTYKLHPEEDEDVCITGVVRR